ncbi:uncharacterized protein KQ657_002030 [Scheffersomyces spartinae]|uniref:Uncharacterized protein n=1 Tax=Scheffersomyces spartinae TaxID=45513 RepID=A0A9P8AH04_9ASCO|nr:uncharacterized protein KQ657_002030 [Scheffersomyces spartinae]KAG7192311.1 hypothetical protein KQ657_002030 [Scheffersomyces spartinae]
MMNVVQRLHEASRSPISPTHDPDAFPFLIPGDRRLAIVTGGNSGIGYYTSLHLYLHGYVVYVFGRSKSRGYKSITEMKEEAIRIRQSYSPSQSANRHLGELHFMYIDFTDLSLVFLAVEEFKRREKYLHVLVNNAGVMALPFQLTKNKFEIQMQTNYIAPFVLTTKLLPLLERVVEKESQKKSSTTVVCPRIIYLSSVGHNLAFRYFSPKTWFNLRPNILFTWLRYGMAKTAGIHFMKMLALRNPKILCVSVHPGFVMNTNLFSYWTRLPIIGILFWVIFQVFGWMFGVSNEQGALASVRCALDPDLTVEKDNGKYYATGGIESEPSTVANNMDYAARTWIWTVHELSKRKIYIPNDT